MRRGARHDRPLSLFRNRSILYELPGAGLGYAMRSKVIIGHLLAQGHQVCVVSSSRVHTMLMAIFPGRLPI